MKKQSLAAFLATRAAVNYNKNSGFPELDEWAEYVTGRKNLEFGYPVNQDVRLNEFYQWYFANDLDIVALNNVGDPFTDNPGLLSSHKFEKEVIEYFSRYYGFTKDNVWGMISSGGTDGNNHGIYFGVNYLYNKTGKKPIMYVCEEAHYSNMRLAHLQNLEMKIIKGDEMGRMIPEEFEKALDHTRPCLLVYAMGSTFKGAIDDQIAINAILDKYPEIQAFRHVDAALFGGYLPFTEYSDLVNRRVMRFDSIAISGHKFFGMDEPCSIFITTKDVYENQATFNIAYLNENMRMISCSRSAQSVLKFWWLIKNVGHDDWCSQAQGILDNTRYFKKKFDEINYPAWVNEYSNTIFFKCPSNEIVRKYNLAKTYDKAFGGELSHLVVMQHVTKQRINTFIRDILSGDSQ